MTLRLKPAGSVLRGIRAAVVLLFAACYGYAQNCPDGNPPQHFPTQTSNTTFCCQGGCCAQVTDSNGNYILGLPGAASGVSANAGFVYNFLGPNPDTTPTNYELPFPHFQTGASGAGDWNARYSALYYSMTSASAGGQTNMLQWENTCGGAGCSGVTPNSQPFCPVELMVAGIYPNARYFSIAAYDEHYTTAQHITDFEIDPATQNTNNPFGGGSYNWYAANYLVPINLGTLPAQYRAQGSSGPLAGCQVLPWDEDNILDGTQRHPAADWNTDVFGSPGTAYPSQSHKSDDPAMAVPIPRGASTCELTFHRSTLARDRLTTV